MPVLVLCWDVISAFAVVRLVWSLAVDRDGGRMPG